MTDILAQLMAEAGTYNPEVDGDDADTVTANTPPAVVIDPNSESYHRARLEARRWVFGY